MKKFILFLCIGLLANCSYLEEKSNQLKIDQTGTKNDTLWRVGAKIHFTEEDGSDYLGMKKIYKITKDILRSELIPHIFYEDSKQENAKILLKKEGDKFIVKQYKENTGLIEELHATLLYTSPRGFHNSETLRQVCSSLFKDCNHPPIIENVIAAYNAVLKPSLTFKISEIILTKNTNGSAFIMANLLINGHEHIYKIINQSLLDYI